MNDLLLAMARLNELGRYSKQREVPLLFDRIVPQNFEEGGKRGLRQALDVVVACEDGPVAFAEYALEHGRIDVLLVLVATMGCSGSISSEKVPAIVLGQCKFLLFLGHQVLYLFGESRFLLNDSSLAPL